MMRTFHNDVTRGGVKAQGQGQGHKKNLRPKTVLPRTDPLKAKDRNAQGQGQGPRTQAQVIFKKKRYSTIFSGNLQNFNNSKK